MTELPLPTLAHEGVSRRVSWLDLLAVMLVTFAVFTPVLRTGFSPLDDYIMILQNQKVLEPTWPHFTSFWTETSFHIYMPLALSTWQLLAWAFHKGTIAGGDYLLSPVSFKVVSVLTHSLAAVAAAWTISTLTRSRWPAMIGALLFAIHPMQVESVAWTTGLKDEYCGLFTILAIGFYARYAERDPETPFSDGWWLLALLAAILATLSKPTAMVLPVLLLAVDWTVRRTSVAKRTASLILFLLPALSIAFIIQAAQGDTGAERVSALLRPLAAGDTYAFYLGKLLWPMQLSVDYGRRPTVILENGSIYWTWIVPVAVLIGVLLMRSRRWVLAAVLFVVPVLPVSGIKPFDMQQYSTVTDHYVYQSLAGVGMAAALLIWRWPRAGVAGGVAVLAVLSVLTYRTATQWENFETLYRRMLAQNPRSWMARDLLGVLAGSRGDLFGMRELYEAALRDNPYDGAALENKSGFLLMFEKYREAADVARQASEKLVTRRLATAKRMTLIGAKLKDIEITEKGLEYWRLLDPENKFVSKMMDRVRLAKMQQQSELRNRPATLPATGPAVGSAHP
ncbi:MAG: Tetratricopeptide 2 repeat protein [Phycisphaerales bacterium]|nr:Tetratricopeptide 2 repeat protein [Phycisphaerales bacterium]